MKKEKPKAFISYSSSNGDFAELLKVKLEQSGIKVWRDSHEIEAGEEWRNEIDYGLLNSDCIIIVLNKSASESAYVTYEWAFALGNGKKVIPVLLENCEVHPRIRVLQYLDFTKNKRPWDVLTERVHQVYKKMITLKNNKGQLSLEQIFDGIHSLVNATEKRNAGSGDLRAATNRMMNAGNYLRSVELESKHILWVDDNPDKNVYEREALKALGFEFDLARSTQRALTLLENNTYCVIVSDMGRVEGSDEGYVLLKTLRAQGNQLPFLIYASSNQLEHKIKAQEKGAQGSTNRADELIDLVTTHARTKPF